MNLLTHVEECIVERGLLRPRARILVAVSGGVDSMVLLKLLGSLSSTHEWRLAIAHLNHQLRGHSSQADERLVQRAAEKLGLPVFIERATVREFAKARRVSIEMAARQLRHEFLARAATKWKANSVALAHHADDQVELFLLRLLRGSGGEGLGGMKWRSPSPAKAEVELIRPLLDVSRADLLEYARKSGVPFREDASNASPDYLRNRIRHELLPLLRRRYQPAVERTILRVMDIVGEDAATTGAAAADWLGRKRGKPERAFGELPRGLQRATVRLLLIKRGLTPDFELVENLVEGTNRRVSVGMDLSAWRDSQGQLHTAEAKPLRFGVGSSVVELKGRAGECALGACRLRWQIVRTRGAGLPARVDGCEWFDADAVGPRITLRHWRAGDRFQPIGLPKLVKLQDLLTNARIPRESRRSLVVAEAANGHLFWVEGLRIAEPFKLTARTNRRLQWCWQRF